MTQFARGLVIGKFVPPHRGHKLLIDAAESACDKVAILVCDSASYNIPLARRLAWLREIHPRADVRPCPVGALADGDSLGWAQRTQAVLGYVPDAVFTSEDYGEPYAAALGSVHISVDPARKRVPVSGTAVRAEPLTYLAYLEPCVRAYFIPLVVVLGAESTGTTTLARTLAAHYSEPWVPEYGRAYSEGRGLAARWTTREFVHIATAQGALEDELARSASRVLICDTDALATTIWHRRYVGTKAPELDLLIRERPPLLYIVTAPDIPFVQDGLRDGENVRELMHEWFIAELAERALPFIVVHGSHDVRLGDALSVIDARLANAAAPAGRAVAVEPAS